jgi:hypothetical protein
MSEAEKASVYDLIDLETGLIVGQMREDGSLVSGDLVVRERVGRAFAQELMVRDGELVEDLGVCFADVETLFPGDPGHARGIIQNLARLAGYLPRQRG